MRGVLMTAGKRHGTTNPGTTPTHTTPTIPSGNYYDGDPTEKSGEKTLAFDEGFIDESEDEMDPVNEFITVPKSMLGQPLKDFDNPPEKPDQPEKTFVVVGNKFGKQVVFRFSREKALWLMSTENCIRRTNIFIFTHQWFEVGILLTIITNCVFMAMSSENKVAQLSEYVFAAIYTFEMIVKILAKGFILHEYSYLRNAWNWLDFVVVILGYVTMNPGISDLSGIRTFRVLRALKTISTVKGLKAMVNTLLKSMKMMTDVMILTVFFIAIFSLIGLQLFMGKLHNRCIKRGQNHTYGNMTFHQNWQKSDVEKKMIETHIERFMGGEQILCSNNSNGWPCGKKYECVPGMGPNPLVAEGSFISYDSFHYSFLTTFQVVTLDYWETVFNSVISATGEVCVLYYLLVVFLGPFYLLNLVLAIVSASYEQEINMNDNDEEEQRKSLMRSASNYSFSGKMFVEYLHGDSPIEMGEDGKPWRYTVVEPVKEEKEDPEEKIDYYSTEPDSQPRRIFYYISNSKPFDILIISCIMFNTIIMASEHHGMPKLQIQIGQYANYVFTGAFVVEMIIKLFAYTPKGYIKNAWNCFDGALVIMSIVDIFVSLAGIKGGPLKILKVFRLLRVLKLAQSWAVMGKLLSTIAESLGAVGNVLVILGLIIYIFSVVGMQLFGGYYKPECYTPDTEKGDHIFPRFNFMDFRESLMMIFRILCGKWIEPQWQLLKRGSYQSIVFILLVFIIGRWVVLNLFLALLLSSFGGDALNNDDPKGKSDLDDVLEKPRKTRLQRLVEWTKKKKKNKKDKFLKQMGNEIGVGDNNSIIDHPDHVSIVLNGANMPTVPGDDVITNQKDAERPPLINGVTSNGDTKGRLSVTIENGIPCQDNEMELKQEPEKKFVDDCVCKLCYEGDCFLTSYLNSPVRRFWHMARYQTTRFIENKYFEGFILFLIAFSSMTLIFEDIYLEEKPDLKKFLAFCNFFFAIIFTLEFLIKLFAFGFIKYFTNFWNLLDVAIVAISLVTLIGKSSKLNALRSLRGLRPLRAISRFEGMKVVVNALVKSIPSIANVLLVCGVFWLIFSIMGYNLFAGQFWRCEDEQGEKIHFSIVPNRSVCDELALIHNYTWKNARIHFDDAINGMLPLFQTATLEGWFEAMADAHDARGVDLQPGYRESYIAQWYFVLFILLGSFFILNLFIGVIIDNFNRLKQQYEDGEGIFLTADQRNWINTLKVASLKKPCRITKRPNSKWRGTLFDFTSSKYFEFFIMSVIILNMTTMMIQHYQQTVEFDLALNYLNYVFTGIFTIEAVIRLLAMELEYFKVGMNIFDFVIVLFSITVIIMEYFEVSFPISPGLFRVIRVFRLGRLLRFIDSAKGIRKLLFTIVKSAPALRNIGTLLFLITFIFAIIGMNLFKTIDHGMYLNPASNFETFLSSFCVLFRIGTAAGWNGVLDTARKDGDVNDTLLVIYFTAYIMLINLIIINMYIAVILENFNQAQSQEDIGISEDDLDAFYLKWQLVDPKATQFIKYTQLSDFIDSLDFPLKVSKPNNWFLELYPIAIKERDVCHCLDIMKALIRRTVGDNVNQSEEIDGDKDGMNIGTEDDLKQVLKKVEATYDEVFPQRKKEPNKTTTKELLKQQNQAARKIQAIFRKHLLLERMDIMTKNTSNLNPKTREKNVTAVEHLVTTLWKRKDENLAPSDPDFHEPEKTDEENIETDVVASPMDAVIL